uniref:Uncharacterized protein n=1 Tax=Leersia perrieri TaxID=77586 RepID=A0A0D9XIU8_9ORYZ
MVAGRPPLSRARMASAKFTEEMHLVLLNAAYDGDLRLLKRVIYVLDNGRGRPRQVVYAARADGVWALHLAAGNEQMGVCRFLVQGLRVDVNIADDKGPYPLSNVWFLYLIRTSCQQFQDLLIWQCPVFVCVGITPLVYAVISENAAVVKYLLDHGADPNKADDDGLSPLHSVAGIGDCEMIELLLAKGAYVDPIADEVGTPLHLATKERKVGAVKALLDHNADCNKTYMIFGLYPMTPLFQAVNVSSVECVKLLVEAGANINSDCISAASLDCAMGNNGSTECLNFLLEAGANRHAPNNAPVTTEGTEGLCRELFTAYSWQESSYVADCKGP